MTTEDIDRYLADLDDPKRATLQEMRRRILEVIPEAEQGISYSLPAFKIDGKTVAGLAAFKSHLSYLPHSGSVLAAVHDKTRAYTQTKSALHFPIDKPLPHELITELNRGQAPGSRSTVNRRQLDKAPGADDSRARGPSYRS